jgi:transglutaminase-like putative cysteine protease
VGSSWNRYGYRYRYAKREEAHRASPKRDEERLTRPAVIGYGSFTKSYRQFNLKKWLKAGFGSPPEWGSVVLTFLALGVAIFSIEQAQWTSSHLPLTLNLALAMLLTLILVKRRLDDRVFFVIMTILGAGFTIWQSARLAAPTSGLGTALAAWWQTISYRQPNQEITNFASFLIFLTWVIGFVSAWFTLRRQNVWIGVGLGAIALLVNLSNLPREQYYFLLVYLAVAMLVIGVTTLTKQQSWFKKLGGRYPKRAALSFVALLVLVSTIAIPSAWFAPEIRVTQAGTVMGGSWGKYLEESWMNLFAAIPGKWTVIKSSDEEKLAFSEVPDQRNTVFFAVHSEQSSYWPTRRYDIYQSWGWTSSNATYQKLSPETRVSEASSLLNRRELTYTVENKLKTDVLLTAGEFVSANIPVFLKTISTGTENNLSTNPAAAQSKGGDILAVISPQMLKPYQRYSVTATVSTATPAELAEAGESYEAWVKDYYLQLPLELPTRVRQQAENVTADAKTPYEKALAIKDFLRNFKYSLTVKPPPNGTGGVDWFLFHEREGFCTNYASAMVVMLRSVGVPARLAVGYLPGEFDEASGTFIIRAKDYHAWSEVYFPEYGWIVFEATASAPLEEVPITPGDAHGDDFGLFPEELIGIGGEGGSPGGTTPTSTQGGASQPYIILGVSLLMLAAVIVVYLRLRRFRQEVKGATQVYAKMCSMASLMRARPQPSETPLEYCRRLAAVLPLQAEAIGTIAQAYVEARFSPRKEEGVYEIGRLRLSWRKIFGALLKRVLRLGR